VLCNLKRINSEIGSTLRNSFEKLNMETCKKISFRLWRNFFRIFWSDQKIWKLNWKLAFCNSKEGLKTDFYMEIFEKTMVVNGAKWKGLEGIFWLLFDSKSYLLPLHTLNYKKRNLT
jgi:hypothetical protein